MTNHIHLIAVPEAEKSLAQALGLAHQRYSSVVNAQHGWTGNLWANRFYSSPLDESHLWIAVNELNPVRAKIVTDALQYPWSSAQAHAGLEEPGLLDRNRPFPGPYSDWAMSLSQGLSPQDLELLRTNTYTCRPTGSKEFVSQLEAMTGRVLRPLKRGRPPLIEADSAGIDDLFG